MSRQNSEVANPHHDDFGVPVVCGRSLSSRVAAGELTVGGAEQTEGGIVIARRVRRTHECLLDVLMDTGALGREGKEANRRLDAGMWLRTLYIEKAMMAPGSNFRLDSSGGRCDTADSIPDDVAWNQKCFTDTMRACHPFGPMLTAVCCHDDTGYPRNGIARALTKLADHRGF